MENQQNPITRWPFGAASVIILAAAAVEPLLITNSLTIIDASISAATEDRALDLEIAPDLEAGACLIVKTKSTATENLIPGEGMKGETIAGEAGKTQVVSYVYDGTNFIQTGKFIQID